MVDILNYLRVFLTKLQLGRDHLVGKIRRTCGIDQTHEDTIKNMTADLPRWGWGKNGDIMVT